MKKREANFQTTFGNYLRAKKLHCNFELKQTTTDSLYINDARLMRQCRSLIAAQTEGYYWKHSDQDQREKPFDGSFVPPQVGYIVIKYPDFFCMILVDDFIKEVATMKGTMLHQDRAKELAMLVIL